MTPKGAESEMTHKRSATMVIQICVVVCITLSFVSCQHLSSQTASSDSVDDIRGVLGQWDQGFLDDDADQVINILADDFLWFTGNQVVLGKTLFSEVLVSFNFIGTFTFDWSEVELWIQENEAIAAPVLLGPTSQGAIGLVNTNEGWKIGRLYMYTRVPG